MKIEIEKLKKTYEGVVALDIERLTIKTGKITAIVQMVQVSLPY